VFGPRISLKALALSCRSLSTMLHSGVAIQRAFRTAANQNGDPRCRTALMEISEAIGRGEDVSSAMRAQYGRFPELMIDMTSVAEQTGTLPEVLRSLADHFDNLLRLRRTFLGAIAWPVFQLVAAILIIAFVIFILGWIASTRGENAVDPLGWGLTGTEGALIWLMSTFGTFVGLFVLYQMAARSMQGQKALDSVLMKIPVLGHCMRSFAIARFSWAFALTQQAGMPIEESLESALKATSNGAFAAAVPLVWTMIKEGDELSEALAATQLFPEEFLNIVNVAETSGTVPEALERLSPQFEEQARRSMSALVAALGWLVWGIVAAFIIFVVFSIALWYIGMINDALKMAQ
jgi:type IV pilus assembly protein PilC